MITEMTKREAQSLRMQLRNAPVAPGVYSHFINAGTGQVLNVLEENYFHQALAEGVSCFKYVEGRYGSGKTQFIHSLAQRAQNNGIVTAIVNIGQECPFNSPSAIYRAVMGAFLPPRRPGDPMRPDQGIEILMQRWIEQKLAEMGIELGQEIPDAVCRQVRRSFESLWLGAPDPQMASALQAIGTRLLGLICGAAQSVLDGDLISWVRGGNVRPPGLKQNYGLYEPVRDETAFRRLKTVVGFLRSRMNYRGFFVAFDEGTRTASFRRGSVKQRQSIENMLTMINENAEGEFAGVMFLYAATPDFRSDVIRNYDALKDRIGSVAFSPGRPMTPLIDLDLLNSDKVTREIGERLMDVFERAEGVSWDRDLQRKNMEKIIETQKDVFVLLDKVPPRLFVYHYCMFLDQQSHEQKEVSLEEAKAFVQAYEPPEREEDK